MMSSKFSKRAFSNRASRAAASAPRWTATMVALAAVPLASLSAQAWAEPCSVWPDRILRVDDGNTSNLVFLLRARDDFPAMATQVGMRLVKRDPSRQCSPGDRSVACRDVDAWIDLPAIPVAGPSGSQWSITLFLGQEARPFLYAGVFYVDYSDGRREWLNNPTDAERNFWFTHSSTASLPRVHDWDFGFEDVKSTADLGHWSNPARCR